MTPGEYKNGGQGLQIHYSFGETPFGNVLIASTGKGICNVFFTESIPTAVENLQQQWPNAAIKQKQQENHLNILSFFNNNWEDTSNIKLHVKGTRFQIKVWEALLRIPFGQLATYSSIAASIDAPKAARAVGTAIGNNPVALIVPCHRVIKSTGIIGDYHWGSIRKTAIIGWESAKVMGE